MVRFILFKNYQKISILSLLATFLQASPCFAKFLHVFGLQLMQNQYKGCSNNQIECSPYFNLPQDGNPVPSNVNPPPSSSMAQPIQPDLVTRQSVVPEFNFPSRVN